MRTFGIVLTAKLKHADLLEAARLAGNQAKLAEHLGIHASVVGRWIGLQTSPSKRWLDSSRGLAAMASLAAFCPKTPEELWPDELREVILGGEIGKRLEQRREVGLALLGSRAKERLTLPSPVDVLLAEEDEEKKRDMLDDVLHTLTERGREVVRGRYGLDGDVKTLEELAKDLQITRERVRQIEFKSVDRIRDVMVRKQREEDRK